MTKHEQASDFDAGLGWLNTDRPLRLRDELRGQVVVLDFWTYCCADCMHVLPDLAYLEEKYQADPVTVIGVHSAKFANEASRQTIRAAILRYEIRHPVVIDNAMTIWRAYGVRSWPTIVVIDSTGHRQATIVGAGHRDEIDTAIATSLQQARASDTLAAGPLHLKREASVRAASGLKFPGKVLADAATNRLFVADSNHNRIVIAQLPDASGRARVVQVVGAGQIGRDDGPADKATFHHPQGLAMGQGNLYVADTENHLIRAINMASYEVSTVVGTGERSDDRIGGGMGTKQGLCSPWDLCIEGSTLYVAMAGGHQIWRVDLPLGFARAVAGTGRENLVDGPAETSAFAQPSGICTFGGRLYVADSEVSAIRAIDLATKQVSTIIGEGLFVFGDKDGTHPKAKLQHPLGVAGWNQGLVVADTYNHKIKQVDPLNRSSRTLLGTGKPGASIDNGGIAFFEPGGLTVVGDEVFVADTNNHRIVQVHLVSKEWTEVMFEGLVGAQPLTDNDLPSYEEIRSEPVAIATNQAIELVADFTLPPGTHLSPEAPWSVSIVSEDSMLFQRTGRSDSMPLRVMIPQSSIRSQTTWHLLFSFAYCNEGEHGQCIPMQKHFSLEVGHGKATSILLRRQA